MTVPSVQSVRAEHQWFVVLSAMGFALLYAELGLFAQLYWHARSDVEAAIIILLGFVVTLMGYAASFVPAKAFTLPGVERQGSLVLPQLVAQLGKGAMTVVAASVLCFVLYLYLVAFDLVAAFTLLNNIYVFTLAGAGLLHGLVTYVRYGRLLYQVKQDSWIKVLAVSGALAIVILGAAQFLMKLDIDWLYAAPAAQRGVVGLHVYGRDLYFFTLVLALYLWHARWMAQH